MERQFESAFPCILVHPLHGLHELLALFKLLEQAIDILDTLATARGNALTTGPVDNAGILPLLRSHGRDDGPPTCGLPCHQDPRLQTAC